VPARSIYSYESYDAIVQNKDIDAVYIAVPTSMHTEYTIRAAKTGKHVPCEKPRSTSVADAEAMIAACKKANRKLQIAYRCQFAPCNLHAIRLTHEGAVQSIVSANGFNIRPGEWRYGKLGGGGPLMDVGIYSLNACRYLTGEVNCQLARHRMPQIRFLYIGSYVAPRFFQRPPHDGALALHYDLA
jgi:predicted dehydrogenase